MHEIDELQQSNHMKTPDLEDRQDYETPIGMVCMSRYEFEQYQEELLMRAKKHYDPEKEEPVVRSSICTGEKTAGFRDIKTGEFHDICLIRDDADLKQFRKDYGIAGEIKTIY